MILARIIQSLHEANLTDDAYALAHFLITNPDVQQAAKGSAADGIWRQQFEALRVPKRMLEAERQRDQWQQQMYEQQEEALALQQPSTNATPPRRYTGSISLDPFAIHKDHDLPFGQPPDKVYTLRYILDCLKRHQFPKDAHGNIDFSWFYWLFPGTQRSRAYPNAPVLTSEQLKNLNHISYSTTSKMMRFLGFYTGSDGGDYIITRPLNKHGVWWGRLPQQEVARYTSMCCRLLESLNPDLSRGKKVSRKAYTFALSLLEFYDKGLIDRAAVPKQHVDYWRSFKEAVRYA